MNIATSSQAVDVAVNATPFRSDPDAAEKRSSPDRRHKWLIPFVIAAQIGLKILLDRVMADDGCKGDASGPYDDMSVRENREELRRERVRRHMRTRLH